MGSDVTINVEFDTSDDHCHAGLDRLAREMFATYNASAGGLTHDGRPIPTFEEVGPKVRRHWRAAAGRAAYLVTAACKRSVGTAVAGELQYPVLPEAT